MISKSRGNRFPPAAPQHPRPAQHHGPFGSVGPAPPPFRMLYVMAVITSWGVGVGAAVSLGVGVGIVDGARVGVRVGIDGIGEEVGVVLGTPPAHPGITNSNRSTPISRLNIIDLMRVILIKYPFSARQMKDNTANHNRMRCHRYTTGFALCCQGGVRLLGMTCSDRHGSPCFT